MLASLNGKQEHLKYGTYAKDNDECSVYFIRTEVLRVIIIAELNLLSVQYYSFYGDR